MRTIASFCLIVVSLLLLSHRAAAQESLPSFTSGADYDFGQEIRFYLSIEEETNVTAVTLFFRTPEFPNAFADEVPFSTGEAIAIRHPVDLSQVRLAPFTTVTYWWVLTTEDGEDIRVPDELLVYEDDQFVWRRVQTEDVIVRWTGSETALGQLALDITQEARPRLEALVPVALAEDAQPLRLYVYPSSGDLRAALRLTGRDWVGAHAHPELGVLLVTAVNPRTAAADLRQSIPHELMHHQLFQATYPFYDDLPAWFNEGLATMAEATPSPIYATVLETAVVDGATIPFANLCRSFPTDEAGALLAYAQSESLLRYIQRNYGNSAIQALIGAYAEGSDCETAVAQTTGMTLEDLNKDWLRTQQPRSPFWQFWIDNGLFFILLAVGFGITGLLIVSPARFDD